MSDICGQTGPFTLYMYVHVMANQKGQEHINNTYMVAVYMYMYVHSGKYTQKGAILWDTLPVNGQVTAEVHVWVLTTLTMAALL